jgi:hypothetical protein
LRDKLLFSNLGEEVMMNGEFLRTAIAGILIAGAIICYALSQFTFNGVYVIGPETGEILGLTLLAFGVLIMGLELEEPTAAAQQQRRTAA